MFKLTKKKLLTIASGISAGSLGIWYFDRPRIPVGSPLEIQVTKTMKFLNNPSNLEIKLFQYQTCPFCCKVRTYLDFQGINYNIVEVNSLTQGELKWSQYKKVPIALISNSEDSIQVNDSSVIISLLESYRLNNNLPLNKLKEFYPELSYVDEQGKNKVDFSNKYQIMFGEPHEEMERIKLETKWRSWVDEVFVHSLSPNIYRTVPEAINTFSYVSESADWVKNFGLIQTKCIIYIGAVVMFLVGKRLKKRYQLQDDVRQSLFDQSDFWIASLGSNKFMGGSKPDLSDLAMYGALLSIEGCAAFAELMNYNSKLNSWFLQIRKNLKDKYKDKEVMM